MRQVNTLQIKIMFIKNILNLLRSIKNKAAMISQKEFSVIEKFCELQNKYLKESDIL